MNQNYIVDKVFEKSDFSTEPLPKAEYENCIFKNCDFSNSDLSNIKFTDCEFLVCNLSLCKLNKTGLRDVKFKDCKMLGMPFYNCNDLVWAVKFENCQLDHSSFYKLKIKKTIFIGSKLNEADMSECDLSHSVFDHCDLNGTKFENTNLEKSDLRSSYNYSIDPEMNRLNKAKFSLSGIPGLLHRYDIEIDEKI